MIHAFTFTASSLQTYVLNFPHGWSFVDLEEWANGSHALQADSTQNCHPVRHTLHVSLEEAWAVAESIAVRQGHVLFVLLALLGGVAGKCLCTRDLGWMETVTWKGCREKFTSYILSFEFTKGSIKKELFLIYKIKVIMCERGSQVIHLASSAVSLPAYSRMSNCKDKPICPCTLYAYNWKKAKDWEAKTIH